MNMTTDSGASFPRKANSAPAELAWRPIGTLLALCALLVGAPLGGCATVGPGQVGVKWTVSQGTQQVPYGEGLHPLASWNKMYVYDTRTLSHDEELGVMTVDGLEVKLNATVRYRIIPQEVVALHQQVGKDYYAKIIAPALRSESRRVIGRYTPEELYSTKRDTLERETQNALLSHLDGKHLLVEAVMIRNVELPASVRAAIDKKLMAEQEVLKMKSALQITRAAAEQRRIEAQGIADYNRTVSASLSS
jgi:regulator of protease activity HflC (stomatin/prohibitin superfamily)